MSRGADKETRDRLLLSAGEALRTNRLDAAAKFARQALDVDPTCVSAKFLAGVALSRTGDVVGAADMLAQTVEAEPNSYEALMALSTVYRQAGNTEGAVTMAQRAAQVRPTDVQAQNNLGRAFLASRRLPEAAAAFERAVALQPSFAPAHHNLGRTFQLEGRDGDAAECFAKATALHPSLENLLAYGHSLLALYDLPSAREVAGKTVAAFSEASAAHLLLCGVLIEQDETGEAELHLRRAIELDPRHEEAVQTAARQLPLGHIDKALANLRRAVAQNPRQVSVYESLTHNQKITQADWDLVDRMQSLLAEGRLGPTETGSLHYALGKALEDLGDYQAAMAHYDDANRIVRQVKFGDVSFTEDLYSRHVDRMIRAFSVSPPDDSPQSDLPILIVGMMRSGTTLAEQILSSHPDVAAAGEQLFWSRNWGHALSADSEIADPDAVARLGAEYVDVLTRLGRGASRVTDKLPGNYMFLGLIHAAVPRARIIHMRRNPLDTCLSIWATPNHAPSEGGHGKASIVAVYRQYLRLMDHWRSVLPAGQFLEIDYEELVHDREQVTRQMADFCGLPWNDACLSPEKNARKVSTLSVWQVRQPVYRSSVERWRKFEPWLGEFRELLELGQT